MGRIIIDGINTSSCAAGTVEVTHRPNTVRLVAYQWAGHQSSVAEGAIARISVIRPTRAEAVQELRRRWMARAAEGTVYVGFGGQFRHVGYSTAAEVEEGMDDLIDALDEAGKTVTGC